LEFSPLPVECKALPIETDTAVVRAAAALERDALQWPGNWDNPRWDHVLDRVPADCRDFVDTDPSSSPFKPWNERRQVQIAECEAGPRFTIFHVHEYYRDWQVLQLAEALELRVEIQADLRDEELWQAARDWKLDQIGRDRQRRTFGTSPAVFDAFLSYRQEFEAVAYFEAYARMASTHRRHALELRRTDPATIDPRFGDDSAPTALAEGVARYGTSANRLLALIRWQCSRWDDWKDSGRERLANEYARFISSTAEAVCMLTGKSFADLCQDIGRVTGHFKPTLKVILPDWVEERREDLSGYFGTRAGLNQARFESLGLDLSDLAAARFGSWLEVHGLYEVFFHSEILATLNQRSDEVARTGYAKEAIALATSLELVVNQLMVGHGKARGNTLLEKIKALWSRSPLVVAELKKHSTLARTDRHTLDDRWHAIDSLLETNDALPAAKVILRAVLIRNEGNHFGLARVSRQRVRDAVEILLDTMFLCWSESQRHAAPSVTRSEPEPI
jgi:hypothetical protein